MIVTHEKTVILGFVFSAIAMFLLMAAGMEYYFFSLQTNRLIDLQNEYHVYIASLKDILHRYHEQHSNETPCDDFILINRDPFYLLQTTTDYFKAHDIEGFSSLQTQFDIIQDDTAIVPVNPVYKAPIKKSKTSKRVLQNTKNYAALHALFSWPIEPDRFWLSSPFGPRRKKDGSRGFHYGIDLAALKGTPVVAAAAGVVMQAGYVVGFGNTIVIKHNNRFSTRYAHLDKIMVSKAKHVTPTTIIGLVGETGHIRKRTKDGSHLHLELYDAGKPINPLNLLPPLYR